MKKNENKFYNMSEVAEILNIKIGTLSINRNLLLENLRYLGYLEEAPNKNYPKERYIKLGYFRIVYSMRNGYLNLTTLVTSEGLKWLQEKVVGQIIESEKEYRESNILNKLNI